MENEMTENEENIENIRNSIQSCGTPKFLDERLKKWYGNAVFNHGERVRVIDKNSKWFGKILTVDWNVFNNNPGDDYWMLPIDGKHVDSHTAEQLERLDGNNEHD